MKIVANNEKVVILEPEVMGDGNTGTITFAEHLSDEVMSAVRNAMLQGVAVYVRVGLREDSCTMCIVLYWSNNNGQPVMTGRGMRNTAGAINSYVFGGV